MEKRKWSFGHKSRNVHTLHIDLPHVGDEQSILLQSDVHFDNPHCNRDLWREHMERARELDAPVFDAGDFFCAMQGKYDPRSSKSDVRPEHARGDYLDALVRTAAEELEPYKDLLTLRAWGNHETAILKRHETDLTARLVERLKVAGSGAECGQFSGWVRIFVTYQGTRRKSFDLFYHHGYGGGGPVTRGVIQANRMGVYLDGAEIVWSGHTHDAWAMPVQKVRLNGACVVEQFEQLHVRTPGYKDEYEDGARGWHIERGAPPKPLGGAWLRVYQHTGGEVRIDVQQAK